jgi:undecaprenyl-diphosphatase
MVIISMAIGYLFSNLLIKNLVRRPRPYTVEGSDFIDWWKLTGSLTDSEYSFPSGHATVSAAFSICFVWHYGFKKGWPMILVPLLIGITRLYFVVHYPTDILAGWTIGTLASLGAFYLVRLLDRLSWMPKVYGWWGIEDLFKKKQPAAAEGAEEPQPEENGKDNPSQPK